MSQPGRDEGLSLVEVLVTVLIVSIIIPVILAFVTNLLQQSQNVRDTMAGVQQDQIAGEALVQYLHGTIVILQGSTATTLNASILAGVNSSATPQTATLSAVLADSANPKVDAKFTTTLSPDGVHFRNVAVYDAVNSSTVFTYWYNNYATNPVTLASTTAPTNAQLSEIVAVGIDVTFLAGPHVPTEGFAAVRPTNFQTTVYLQNASGAPAPTTSISVASSGTIAVGSPLTLTATVSPVPDGGTVTFSVTEGGTPLSVCTAPVAVDTTAGTASCQFTPSSGGTYDVSATFSGTSDFQPSTSSVTAIVVPIATTTTFSVAASSRTLTITATVTAADGSTPNGTVNFKLQKTGFCFGSGCTFTGSAPLNASGVATFAQGGLSSGTAYTITVTYAGNATYQSSSASGSGTPT